MSDTSNNDAPLPESASAALPDVTPDMVSQALEVSQRLDPDLAAAVNAGNGAVINAIAGGATTTQQVVDLMIRMGVPASMCPPGVAQLVNARLKEFEAEREAEADFRAKAAAGLAALATFAGGSVMANSARAAQGNSANPEALTGAQMLDMGVPLAAMDMSQRVAYFDHIAAMSVQDFDALAPEKKEKIREDNIAQAKEGQAEAMAMADAAYQEKLAALSPEQQRQVRQHMEGADFIGSDGKIDHKAVEEFKKGAAKIEDPAVRAMVEEYGRINEKKQAHDAAERLATTDKLGEATHPNQTGAAQQNATGINATTAQMAPGQDLKVAATAAKEADSRLGEVADVGRVVETARDSNLSARKERSMEIAQAAVKAELADDGGLEGDEPAAPQLASVREERGELVRLSGDDSPAARQAKHEAIIQATLDDRQQAAPDAPSPSIDGRPLAAAGQLAPDSGIYVAAAPEAANDPSEPAQQRKMAPASPGMAG